VNYSSGSFPFGAPSSKQGTIFFQNQCFLHSKIISSMGTPLVSGKKRYTKAVMIQIQPAKNRKIPYLNVYKRDRKTCAIANVKRRFTGTVIACPTERVSSGKISLGTVHPRGPHVGLNIPTLFASELSMWHHMAVLWLLSDALSLRFSGCSL